MKKDMLRRLAALLMCCAMLLSGLGFADEMGGVDTEESVSAQTATTSEAEEHTDAPESKGTPDSVLDAGGASEVGENVEEDSAPEANEKVEEAGATETGEQVEEDGGAETGEQVEEDADTEADEQVEEDADAEADEQVEEGGVPEADEQSGEVSADEETDDGLVEGSQDAAVYATPNEDNGILPVAVAPADCANGHKFVDAEPQRKPAGFASRDANGHVRSYEVITGKVCSVCGLFDPDTYKVSKETGAVEPHDYCKDLDMLGTCSVCGYTCKHTDATKTVSDTVTWDGYTVISDKQHVHVGHKDVTFECECGASSENCDYMQNVSCDVTEDHVLDAEGRCVCGYEAPAEGHVHVWNIITPIYYDADGWAPSPEGCVSTGVVHRSYTRLCSECDNIEEHTEDDPDGKLVEKHQFDQDGSGVCERCGYACPHEHIVTDVVEQSDVLLSGTVKNNGNGTHSGKYVQTVKIACVDCNYSATETRVVEGIQKCTFSVGEDGTCVCGAKKSDHTHTWSGRPEDIVTTFEPDGECTDSGDGKTHVYPGGYIHTEKICTICGESFDEKSERVESYSEPHYVDPAGQYCEVCDADVTCEHELEARFLRDETLNYFTKDQEKHSVEGSLEYYCTKCGVKVDTWEENLPLHGFFEEPHVWADNGVCCYCGEVRACTHEKLHEATPVVKTVYKEIPGDDEMHEAIVSKTYICPTCQASVTEEEAPQKVPHDYRQGNAGGKCASEGCGHVCKHSQVNDEYIASDPYLAAGQDFVRFEESENDAKHSVVRQPVYYCPCGEIVPYGSTITVQEDHEYEDGVCVTEIYGQVCGHVCQHAVKKLDADKAVKKESDKLVSDNDDTHSRGYTLTTPWTCPCGKSGEEVEEHPTGDPVQHNYVKQGEDYVCAECGRKCTHSGVTPMTETAVSYPEEGTSEDGHTPRTTTTTTIDCTHGHEKIVKTEAVDGDLSLHRFEEGVCADCGYECAHPQREMVEGQYNVIYASNGAKGHTLTYDLCEVECCVDCGMETGEPVLLQAGVTETQEHSFTGSKCTLCGYEKSAEPKPEAPKPEKQEQEAAVDVPALQEVAPETPVHGVTADSSTRMATALGTAVAEIEKEYGAGAQLSIQNAEKVLPEKEYASFSALPAQEQVMVLVAVLSGESEAETGANELGMTLSGDAEALIANLRDWMQSMTTEESAAFMELVKEFFTTEGEDDHLVITLEIKTESGTRLERYGFDLVDGAWVLSKLEVAGAE